MKSFMYLGRFRDHLGDRSNNGFWKRSDDPTTLRRCPLRSVTTLRVTDIEKPDSACVPKKSTGCWKNRYTCDFTTSGKSRRHPGCKEPVEEGMTEAAL